MNVIQLESGKKKQWEEYVEQHPDSIAWHCYQWSEVVSKHYQVAFYPFAVLENNRIKGILPLYKAGSQLYSVAYAVAGGILADNKEAAALLLDQAIATCKKEQAQKITFKQYKNKLDGDLSMDENYFNRELDLLAPLEDIWDGLASDNREVLDSLRDEQYSLDFSTENLDLFYKLLFNHSHRNGIPCVSKAWIKSLFDFKMYLPAILKRDGRVLAATLFKQFKRTVSFPFTCTTGKDTRSIKNVYILYWLLIKHFKQQGLNIYHSGRIPVSGDTDIYRLGWGGTKYRYFYQYYPRQVKTTEHNIKRGRKRAMLSAMWKVTPKFITRKIGPKIVARFP